MRHTRSISVAAAAVVGLAALSACSAASTAASHAASSADSAVSTVADALSLATTKTESYNSVKMNMSMTVAGQNVTSSGQFGWNPMAMTMGMNMPAANGRPATSMIMMMSGTTMYMGTPTAADFQGKHWMKLDLSSLQGGQALTQLATQSGNQNPAVQLKLLTSSPGVTRVGQGTVDGVQATHYRGTVDLKALAAKMAGQDAQLKSLLTSASQQGMTTETVDLWVSDQNLPVRETISAATSSGAQNATIDFSDYSTSTVTVTPPPADDTLDASSLLGSD